MAIAAALALVACSSLQPVPMVDGRYALEPGERVRIVLDDGRELLIEVHSASATTIVGTKAVSVMPKRNEFEDPARADAFAVSPNQSLRTIARRSPADPELVEIPTSRIRSMQRGR